MVQVLTVNMLKIVFGENVFKYKVVIIMIHETILARFQLILKWLWKISLTICEQPNQACKYFFDFIFVPLTVI